HQTQLRPIEVMADTAGVSDVVFGLFWLLGYQFSPRLVLQRGFTPVGSSVPCGACDVRDTPHGFAAGDRRECPVPTAGQTRGGGRPLPTPSPPGVTSLQGLFFNRRLMRTTKKCARITNVI